MATKASTKAGKSAPEPVSPPATSISYAEIARQAEAARRSHGRKRRAGRVAVRVRYDRMAHRIEIEMSSGFTVGVPISAIRELRDAEPSELAAVMVDELGSGVIWPELDVAVSVMGILTRMLGQREIMAAAGRAAGSVVSEAKARAARANGKKGGRPRKNR